MPQVVFTGKGSRLKASALACTFIPLNFRVNSNLDKYRDQRLTLADACGEVGLSAPSNRKGLWSVIKSNL